MRMERKLKKIGPQGGRGWGTAIISKGQQLKEIGPQADGGCDE